MIKDMSSILEYLKYLIATAFHPTSIKTAVAIFLYIYGFFFDPSQRHAHSALFFLIIFDFISGVQAAKHSGEKIRSSRIRHTAVKISAYFTMISAGHLAESGLPNFLQVIDETVTGFLLVTELKSLLENMNRLGYDTPKKLLERLADFKKKS